MVTYNICPLSGTNTNSHSLVFDRPISGMTRTNLSTSVARSTSYAYFRRRETWHFTIYVHFQGQINSHSLVFSRSISGMTGKKFVNLRVLLDSSYAYFRRRETWHFTKYVHFRGQINFYSLVFGRPIAGMTAGMTPFCRHETCYRVMYVHLRGQTNSNNPDFRFDVALTKETTKIPCSGQ